MVSKITKIEGVNGEIMAKLKAAEQKLLAKAKAKIPNASDVIIKMSPTLVNAKSGKFYRGGLYATEDGGKWVKCAEVRVREGKKGQKEGAGEPAKPTAKPAKVEPESFNKRAFGTKLLSFMNSKLSGLTYKYKFSSVVLNEGIGGEMLGEARVKCTMLRSLASSGATYVLNRKAQLASLWISLQIETGRQIEERLTNQTIDGWKLIVSRTDFGSNPPSRESFLFSVVFKLKPR